MVSGMTRWWNRCFVSISITSLLPSLRAKISGCYIRGRWVHNKNASSSFFHDLKHFMSLDRCRWKDVGLNVYYCSLVFSPYSNWLCFVHCMTLFLLLIADVAISGNQRCLSHCDF